MCILSITESVCYTECSGKDLPILSVAWENKNSISLMILLIGESSRYILYSIEVLHLHCRRRRNMYMYTDFVSGTHINAEYWIL